MSPPQVADHAAGRRRFKPYAAYKDSGVEWLGEIPAHWEILRLRRLLSRVEQGWSPDCENRTTQGSEWGVLKVGCVNGGVFNPEEHKALPNHVSPLEEFEIHSGDILVSRANTRELLGSAALVAEVRPRLLLCDKLYRLRVLPNRVVPRFLVRLLASDLSRYQLEAEATGASSSMQNIAQETVRSLSLPIPPFKDQVAIAAFLDRETARIDALVAKKERLIELLQEKRTALITRAVTKGLDPNVRMKASGVAWLGEIPAHWDTTFLDKLVDPLRRITYGIVQPGEPDPDGIFMVRGQNYSRGWSRPENIFRVSAEIEAPYRRARLRQGDIVMTIVGAGTGNVAIVPDWLEGANLTQTTARIAFDARTASNRYFAYQLKSVVGIVSVDLTVKGAAQPGLNLGHVAKYRVIVPPMTEQTAIADFLDRETMAFDAMLARLDEGIDRLQELRAALISAAVTGKMDVREEAA